jgi:methanogenic corrinoid protein MtbC1
MVGGAVLSESLAQKIDADFYAKDALTGVRIAEKIYS